MVGVEEGRFIVWGGVYLYTCTQILINSSSAREGLGGAEVKCIGECGKLIQFDGWLRRWR